MRFKLGGRHLLFGVQLIRGRSSLSYVHGASTVPLVHDTIHGQLRKSVERNADRPLFVFSQQNVRRTYGDVFREVHDLARGFLHLGMQRGDRVGIWAPNYYEWVLVQLAAAATGLILVNLSPAYQSAELKYALKKVGVKTLVLPMKHRQSNYYDILSNAVPEMQNAVEGCGITTCAELPNLEHVVVFGDEGLKLRGAWRFEELCKAGGSTEEQKLNEIGRSIQTDDPANIEFTSGTTGNPKAVVLSHHNIVNNANFCGINLGYDKEISKVCVPNPLFHCFACVVGVVSALIHGAACVFPAASVDPRLTIEAMAKERCTTIYGTPTMFIDVLNNPALSTHDLTATHTGVAVPFAASLTQTEFSALVAGAPVPASLISELTQRTHLRNVVVGFGCTELTTAVSLSRPTDPLDKRMKTVGHVTPHLEMCIMNTEGQVLPRGQAGEICVRGYSRMLSYWDDPIATTAAISTGGWFHMGDVGCVNEDDSISVVGRLKDMIIRGGENIYPAEIENLIAHHPLVRDVQVVGIPDERMGEEVCAVIQLKSDVSMDETKLRDYCRERISHFKVPRFILFKTHAFFPRTLSGKVKKNVLAQLCVEEFRTYRPPQSILLESSISSPDSEIFQPIDEKPKRLAQAHN